MNKRPVVFLHLLIALSTSSMAMSLGRQRGAAIIGKPLDISIQAVLDSAEADSATCLSAEVFFGDSQVNASRIRVTSQPASPGSPDATIRIRSTGPVDEPVVTVNLRAGCQQKTERRYVLLADLAGQSAAEPSLGSDVPLVAPSSGGGSSAPAGRSSPQGGASGQRVRQSGLAGPAKTPGSGSAQNGGADATGATSPLSTPAAKRPASLVRKPSAPAKPRLMLEPLDLTIDRDPSLRLSTELLSTPAADDQQRSAAAALWSALTAQPEDILRNTEKLTALEKSVAALEGNVKKNQAALLELNGQVQKAQSERYANNLVYLLALLLAAALAAAAYFWRRSTRSVSEKSDELPWWRKSKGQDNGWTSSRASMSSSGMSQPLSGAASEISAIRQARNGGGVDLELDLQSSSESNFGVFRRKGSRSRNSIPPLHSRDKPDFAMSMTTMARAVKAEELFDVQQQADFFVSLGQHEQAIEVLQEHIASNVETSALVYLDLFNLYHLLKRKDDYEALREDFGELFNARMPEFSEYTSISPGLEAYPAALDRIEALWPSPKVLEVIEESIFRQRDADTEAFDLGAYRELLLLYAIAKEVIASDTGISSNNKKSSLLKEAMVNSAPSSFAATAIQPLSASAEEYSLREDPAVSLVAPGNMDLDLDLSEFPDISENGFEHTYPGQTPVAELESDSRFFAQFESAPPTLPPTLSAMPEDNEQSATILADEKLLDFDDFNPSIAPIERGKSSKS